MNEYEVVVTLAQEGILMGAENDQEALTRAKQIIAEQYGDSVAKDATYEVKKMLIGNLSRKINLIHHNIQELENHPDLIINFDYSQTYEVLEQVREILERESA